MKHRHLLLCIAMVPALAASAHAATILNFTTFDGTEPTSDGNLSGFGNNGTNEFDTVNGWTWGTDFALAGGPGNATGVFAGLPAGPVGAIDDAEIRVGAGLELETAGGGAFFFGFGNNTNGRAVLAQQFNGVGLGQTVTVNYDLDAFSDMKFSVDNGSGSYADAGALDGSFDFVTTGSGNIRIALLANNTGDSNTRLRSISVSAVPEPSAALLGGLGLLGLLRRRR